MGRGILIKVILLSHYPPRKSGIAVYTKNLAVKLEDLGIKIIKISQSGISDFNVDFTSLKLFRRIERIIRKVQGDILHVQYGPATFSHPKLGCNLPILPLLTLQIPMVFTIHEPIYELQHFYSIRTMLRTYVQNQIVKKADKIVVHTKKDQKLLSKLSKNTVKIPHPSRDLQFSKKKEKEKNLLFFGFLRENKGPDLLIKASKYLSGFKIKIVGSTDDKMFLGKLRRLSANKNNVELETGWVTKERKDKLFKWSDIVVLPYRSLPSQSGILEEAISYKRPVVVTEEPGFMEVLKEMKVGVTVSKTPSSIAKGVKKVFKHYSDFKFNIKSTSSVKTYREAAKRHLQIYNELLGNKVPSSFGKISD